MEGNGVGRLVRREVIGLCIVDEDSLLLEGATGGGEGGEDGGEGYLEEVFSDEEDWKMGRF